MQAQAQALAPQSETLVSQRSLTFQGACEGCAPSGRLGKPSVPRGEDPAFSLLRPSVPLPQQEGSNMKLCCLDPGEEGELIFLKSKII